MRGNKSQQLDNTFRDDIEDRIVMATLRSQRQIAQPVSSEAKESSSVFTMTSE